MFSGSVTASYEKAYSFMVILFIGMLMETTLKLWVLYSLFVTFGVASFFFLLALTFKKSWFRILSISLIPCFICEFYYIYRLIMQARGPNLITDICMLIFDFLFLIEIWLLSEWLYSFYCQSHSEDPQLLEDQPFLFRNESQHVDDTGGWGNSGQA